MDTSFLIDAAQADGKADRHSKTYPKGRMEFVVYDPQKLKQTSFGLLEPEDGSQGIDHSEIDLIHVPGVAFQKDGYRLGYGRRLLRSLFGRFRRSDRQRYLCLPGSRLFTCSP